MLDQRVSEAIAVVGLEKWWGTEWRDACGWVW